MNELKNIESSDLTPLSTHTIGLGTYTTGYEMGEAGVMPGTHSFEAEKMVLEHRQRKINQGSNKSAAKDDNYMWYEKEELSNSGIIGYLGKLKFNQNNEGEIEIFYPTESTLKRTVTFLTIATIVLSITNTAGALGFIIGTFVILAIWIAIQRAKFFSDKLIVIPNSSLKSNFVNLSISDIDAFAISPLSCLGSSSSAIFAVSNEKYIRLTDYKLNPRFAEKIVGKILNVLNKDNVVKKIASEKNTYPCAEKGERLVQPWYEKIEKLLVIFLFFIPYGLSLGLLSAQPEEYALTFLVIWSPTFIYGLIIKKIGVMAQIKKHEQAMTNSRKNRRTSSN